MFVDGTFSALSRRVFDLSCWMGCCELKSRYLSVCVGLRYTLTSMCPFTLVVVVSKEREAVVAFDLLSELYVRVDRVQVIM